MTEASSLTRNGADSTQRLLLIAACVGAMGLLLALGYPLFQGRVYVGTDLGNFYVPVRHFYQACLSAGESFVWWPHEFAGFYLHGEGQAGLYHPFNWLLYRIPWLDLAINLEMLRSYVLLFVGSFFALRKLALPREAAGLGALVFTFSSFNLLHYMHLNVIAGIAHIPWLLLEIDWLLRAGTRRQATLASGAVVLTTASQLLISHPQIVWLSVVVEVIAAICILGVTRNAWGAARLVLAKLLGLLCASVQLLPVWETLWTSVRAAPTDGFLRGYGLHPIDLFQFVSPYTVGFEKRIDLTTEFNLYAGMLAPVLCVWLIIRWRVLGRWRWPVAVAALAGALALMVSLGHRGWLHELHASLPIVGLFRAPARYTLITQIAAAMLVAIGFAELCRAAQADDPVSWRRLWPLALPAVVSVLYVITVALFGSGFSRRLVTPLGVPWGPALAAIAGLLVALAARRARGALIALVLFAAIDLGLYGLSYVWRDDPKSARELAAWALPPEKRTSTLEKLGGGRLLWARPAVAMSDIRQLGGYVAMTPERRILQSKSHVGPLNLQFAASMRELHVGARRAALRVASVGWAGGAIEDRLARARLITRAVATDDPRSSIASIDVATTALLDEPLDLAGGAVGTATLVRDRPGDIHVTTESETRQLLVLSESFHPGWRVDVDGEPREVLRAYGDFMAVVVEPGLGRVEFSFDPASLRDGKRLSLLGLALTGAWMGIGAAGGNATRSSRSRRRSGE